MQLLRSNLKPAGKLIVVLPAERHGLVQLDIYKGPAPLRSAQYDLRHLGKLSFPLYRLQTRLLGRLFNRRDMVAVAKSADAPGRSACALGKV